jgi:hypothetical protein
MFMHEDSHAKCMHLQPSAMVILKIGGALVVQKQIKTHSRYLECVFICFCTTSAPPIFKMTIAEGCKCIHFA